MTTNRRRTLTFAGTFHIWAAATAAGLYGFVVLASTTFAK
jgi:hypothetical protein